MINAHRVRNQPVGRELRKAIDDFLADTTDAKLLLRLRKVADRAREALAERRVP
jgi:hypothetical protein